MKKVLLMAILATSLFACKQNETKVETANTGSVTATGPDVELMKKAQNAWATADWATYLSCYADTAVSVHNGWASVGDTTVGKKVSFFVENFKKNRELMDGNYSIDHSIYEVVTMPDGSKYGHAWADVSWKLKDGTVSKTVIFNSYGIKDGKITYEWPIYDTKEFNKMAK